LQSTQPFRPTPHALLFVLLLAGGKNGHLLFSRLITKAQFGLNKSLQNFKHETWISHSLIGLMATNWIARRSREQPIGTEAEPSLGARQISSKNAKPHASYSDEREKGYGERRNSRCVRDPIASSRPRSRGRADEEPSSRTGTAGRFSRSKSRSRREGVESRRRWTRSRSRGPSKSEEAAKDLADRPPPQLTRLDCSNVHGDASTIGVAVGSPSQWQPTKPASLLQSPLSNMEAEAPNSNDQYWQDAANKSRNPRWKKIGDLFKAKAALSGEPSPSPFYQLQAQYAAHMANQSQSSLHSHSIHPDSEPTDARFLFDKILAPDGQLGRQNHVESRLPHLHGAQKEETDTSTPSDYTSSQRPATRKGLPLALPLLDVQIPNVQMERYSVMFGNLLKQQESPSLLSRRDKTLRNLLTISDEEDATAGAVQVQRILPEKTEASDKETHSHLTPDAHNAYPRRATSPTPSKSPSFSLFPQLPQAPEKIVGPIPPGKQSPLQRSFTAPARLSPMQERFSLGQVQAPKVDHVKTGHQTVSSPQTASTSDPRRESSSHSIRSPPTSTRSSLIEDVLLNLGSQDSVERKQDQSELMNDGGLKVAPLKFKHVDNNVQSLPLTSQEVGSEVEEVNRVNIHEDTLAALERPRSITSSSKDVASSLKPSKARIDQIMRGVSPNPLSESPAQGARGKTSAEESQRKVAPEMPPKAVNSPAPRTEVEIVTLELRTSAVSGQKVAAKEHKPRMASRGQEKLPMSSHTRAQKEVEVQDAPQLMKSQQQPLQGPNALGSSEPRSTNATQLLPGHTRDDSVPRIRQPPRQLQPIQGQAPQFINGQTQSRPPVVNTSHRLHPRANPPQLARPSFNPNNRFPTYRPPPTNFRMPQPTPYQVSHQRPNTATTPPTENDQDILDYYLEESVTNAPLPPPKSPKKLQKRISDKPKIRFSLSKKPLPDAQAQEQAQPQPQPQPQPQSQPQSQLQPQPQMQPKPIQPIETAPRSPVPVSKYSPNATVPNSIISPPIAALRSHDHSRSYSSTLSEQDPLDPHLLSPAVRAAREKAAKIIKASSAEDLGLIPSAPSTSKTSRPPRSSSRTGFSLTVDAPAKTQPSKQTSFYSHSDTSSPSLDQSPQPLDKVLGSPHLFSEPHQQQGQQQQQQSDNTLASRLKRHQSKGASLSSLPPGAGGAAPRCTSPHKPPQPVRSSSAGTVGVGAAAPAAPAPGLLCHLKPGKGEKVVEVQAGLVPRIVEQRCGHRPGRSVNVVIESI
jgi:hypothetical protein